MVLCPADDRLLVESHTQLPLISNREKKNKHLFRFPEATDVKLLFLSVLSARKHYCHFISFFQLFKCEDVLVLSL